MSPNGKMCYNTGVRVFALQMPAAGAGPAPGGPAERDLRAAGRRAKERPAERIFRAAARRPEGTPGEEAAGCFMC